VSLLRHKGRIARRGARGDDSVAIELDDSKRKDLMRDWSTDDPEMELLPPEAGVPCPMPLDATVNDATAERVAYANFCGDYERIAQEMGRNASSGRLREMWAILPAERKQAYLCKAALDASWQLQVPANPPAVPAALSSALAQAQVQLVPQIPVGLNQDAVSDGETNEFYSRLNAATDRMHTALEGGHWVYLHGEDNGVDENDDGGGVWARACVAAYLVRYRDQPPAEALRRAFEGLGGSKARAGLEAKLKPYAPILFSVALFKVGATTTDGEDSNRWFTYYASSAVGFIRNKLKTFPGCDFIFHVNEEVGDEVGLLHSMYKEAHGRIEFHEYRFTPRKRIAPWLIAAMRLAPLLDCRWRLVVSADIHDQRDLQNSQLSQMIAKLRRQRKEMLITYWIAEDSNDECMVSSPLPVGKSLAHVLSKSGANVDGVRASELHTHTDAGLLVFRGARCRDAISDSHDGTTFISHLSNLVRGAKTIPHGVEEMAFDLYLFEADWAKLQPFTQFDVHVNVMMGAEDGNIRANWVDETITTDTKLRYDVAVNQIDFDVGAADWQVQLPCCRHSRAFDCEHHAKKVAPKSCLVAPKPAAAASTALALAPTGPVNEPTRHESGIYARAEWDFHPPISETDRTLLPLQAGESMYIERGKDDAWALVVKPNGLRGFVPTNYIKVLLPDDRSQDSTAAVTAFRDAAPMMKPARAGWLVCWSAQYTQWYYWPIGGGISQWEDPGEERQPALSSKPTDPAQKEDSARSEEAASKEIAVDAYAREAERQLEEANAKAGEQRAQAKQALVFYARKEGSSTGTWYKFRNASHAYGQLPISQYSAEEAAQCIDECCQGKRAAFGGYVFCKENPSAEQGGASTKAAAFKEKMKEVRKPTDAPIFALKAGAVGGQWHCFRNVGAAKRVLPISEYSDRECFDAIEECCVGKRESFGGYHFSKDRATGQGRKVAVKRLQATRDKPERWGSSFENLKIATAKTRVQRRPVTQEDDDDDDDHDDSGSDDDHDQNEASAPAERPRDGPTDKFAISSVEVRRLLDDARELEGSGSSLPLKSRRDSREESEDEADGGTDEKQPAQRRTLSRKRFEPARWSNDPHAIADLGGDETKYRNMLKYRKPQPATTSGMKDDGQGGGRVSEAGAAAVSRADVQTERPSVRKCEKPTDSHIKQEADTPRDGPTDKFAISSVEVRRLLDDAREIEGSSASAAASVGARRTRVSNTAPNPRKREEPARWSDDKLAVANVGGDIKKYRQLVAAPGPAAKKPSSRAIVQKPSVQKPNTVRTWDPWDSGLMMTGMEWRRKPEERKKNQSHTSEGQPTPLAPNGREDLWSEADDRHLRERVLALAKLGQSSVKGTDWQSLATEEGAWSTKRNGPALRLRWYYLCQVEGVETNSLVSPEHVLFRDLRSSSAKASSSGAADKPRDSQTDRVGISMVEVMRLLADAREIEGSGGGSGASAAAGSRRVTSLSTAGPNPKGAALARKAAAMGMKVQQTSRSGRVIKQQTRAPGFVDVTDKSLSFASPKGGFGFRDSHYANDDAAQHQQRELAPAAQEAIATVAANAATAAVTAAQSAAAQAQKRQREEVEPEEADEVRKKEMPPPRKRQARQVRPGAAIHCCCCRCRCRCQLQPVVEKVAAVGMWLLVCASAGPTSNARRLRGSNGPDGVVCDSARWPGRCRIPAAAVVVPAPGSRGAFSRQRTVLSPQHPTANARASMTHTVAVLPI
jgi:hypothetical protein